MSRRRHNIIMMRSREISEQSLEDELMTQRHGYQRMPEQQDDVLVQYRRTTHSVAVLSDHPNWAISHHGLK
jgi:hypothetical protein